MQRALFTLPHQFFGGGVVVSLGVVGAVGAGTGVTGGVVVPDGIVVVPVPPVPLVPVVPLVPDVVVGVVVVASPGGVTTVVSVFLQAPSMAAMTAAVRMIFDALEIAFIV